MTLAYPYTQFAKSLVDKECDLDSDTLKVMLLSAYTVGTTKDTARYVSDILAVGTQVASGGGYTTGGATFVNRTFTRSGSLWVLDLDDPLWAASTITASYALFYDSTPATDATRPIICYWDFEGAKSSSGTDFKLLIHTDGLLRIQT